MQAAMPIVLGSLMIAIFMYLIVAKRWTPTSALVLVPLGFAVVVHAFGVGGDPEVGVVDSTMSSLSSVAPTAVLLLFAIILFGTVIDVGLFDPLIRGSFSGSCAMIRCGSLSGPRHVPDRCRSTVTARRHSSSRSPRCCRSIWSWG